MKIGLNKDINKAQIYGKKSPQAPPESGRSHGAVHLMKSPDKPIKEIDNQKIFAGKHDNEKLAITLLVVGTRLIAYYFCWVSMPLVFGS